MYTFVHVAFHGGLGKKAVCCHGVRLKNLSLAFKGQSWKAALRVSSLIHVFK